MGDSDRVDDRVLSPEEWRERETREAMERVERKVREALWRFTGFRRLLTPEERTEMLDLFPEIN